VHTIAIVSEMIVRPSRYGSILNAQILVDNVP
jgi:hypothetical protein